MKKVFFIVSLSALFICHGNLHAESRPDSLQSKTSSIDMRVDLMSRYVWRGTEFGGNSPSIQPSITYKNRGFKAGAWGAFSTGGINTSQELDLFASVTLWKEMVTLTVTDYFFPSDGGSYNYFKYGKNVTGHIFEGSISFNGTEKLPVTFLLATNFYGADAIRIGNNPHRADFNRRIGIQHSTYFEFGYTFHVKKVSLNSFIGFNATSPRKANAVSGYVGEQGFYGNGFGIINLGLTANKSIRISNKYSLPLSTSLITNPQAGKVYFVVGISF